MFGGLAFLLDRRMVDGSIDRTLMTRDSVGGQGIRTQRKPRRADR